MSMLPLEISNAISQLHTELQLLESTLTPMLNYPSLTQINVQLTVEDLVRLDATVAYALQSLYFVCMRTHGEQVDDHPIGRELSRVQKCVRDVQEFLRGGGPNQAGEDKETNEGKSEASSDAGSTTHEKRGMKGSTPLPLVRHLTWKEELDQILGPK